MSENRTYFRQFTLMYRKPGTTAAAFKAHWSGKHAELALSVPMFRTFVQRYEQVRFSDTKEVESPG